jgi:hypothetical protein
MQEMIYMNLDSNLNDNVINELLNASVEHEHLDYKEDLDINTTFGIVSIAKDMLAMSNSGGGNIVIGVDKNFNKKGLDLSFRVDEADFRNKISKYFNPKIGFAFKEFTRDINNIQRKFAIISILPSDELVLPIKDGNYERNGRQMCEFRCGDIYIRDGSESKRADYFEVRRIINRLVFDKKIETQKRFIESINKIIEVGSIPDKKKELLSSNLLPISSIPAILWGAPTSFTFKEDVYKYLLQMGNANVSSFILRDNRLFTFSDLRNSKNPLRLIINESAIESYSVSEWKKDVDKWRWIIELLHSCLKNYSYKRSLSYDKEHRRFYFPASPFKTREIRWKTPLRQAKRQVATYYRYGDKGYYLHRSVKLRFVTLGDQIFLLIEPGIMFTYDGKTPVISDRFHRLSTKLEHDQYNTMILNDVRFWATVLTNSNRGILISDGEFEIIISTSSMCTQMEFGIREETDFNEKMTISEKVQFNPQSVESDIKEIEKNEVYTDNNFEDDRNG